MGVRLSDIQKMFAVGKSVFRHRNSMTETQESILNDDQRGGVSLKRPEKYRADIDGLGAIALTSVLFYHVGFSGFSGGFANGESSLRMKLPGLREKQK